MQPLLVLFEDLHWIDAETQAFLDSLVESLPTARLLLLVNYRPEYRHGWGGKTYYRQLQINPLAPESAEVLLDALLGNDTALAPLKRLMIERTEGNPFFVEESVRSLVETGVLAGERGAYRVTRILQGLRVPATAQAMLAARIDRLDPEDKRLLQAAAVIGTDVPFSLLQAVADEPEDRLRQGLAQLQATEFLYETRLFPDLEYTFRHALTHEVAYGGLLQERRRELHARIVEAIETLHQDRLDAEIERLAHHAVRGELREKAVDYTRQAGLKAAARSALSDARVWFEQALGVLEALPESPSTLEQSFEIRLELRPVLNQLGEVQRVRDRLREAEALAERLNDDRRRGRAGAFVTMALNDLGELDDALVTGTRALAIAGRLGDVRLRILATSCLVEGHYYRGEYERVVELATGNLAALPADWASEYFGLAVPPSVLDRSYLAMSLAQLGRFIEAATHEAEAIRLAEPTRHAHTVGWAHLAAGTLRLLKGDWPNARTLIEHWIAVVRPRNVVFQLPTAVASSAWALAQLGEAGEALNRLREAEPLLERQAARGLFAYRGLGLPLAGSRRSAARPARRGAVPGRSRGRILSGAPGFAAHARHLLGDHRRPIPTSSTPASGEAHYREALALAEPRGMRPLVAHCHLGLGKLYRRTGDGAKAEEHLDDRDHDVPRDGHDLLAGEGRRGAGWSRAMTRVERRGFIVGTLSLLAGAARRRRRSNREGLPDRISFRDGRRDVAPEDGIPSKRSAISGGSMARPSSLRTARRRGGMTGCRNSRLSWFV